MALQTGSLLRITDVQEYLGQQVLNVYFYRYFLVLGASDSAYEELANDFKDNLLDAVTEIQNEYLVHKEVRVENISNGIDIYTLSINEAGKLTASESILAPSNVTVGFILRRGNRVTRNGYKRYSGLTDNSFTGNNYIVPSAPNIAAIEAKLSDGLYLGAVKSLEPVIIKRPFNEPVGYDYFYSPITSAALVGLGTQNTRKAGRGV